LTNAGIVDATLTAEASVSADVTLGNATYAYAQKALQTADGFVYRMACDGSLSAGGTADGRLSSPYSTFSYAMTIEGVAPSCRVSQAIEGDGQQLVAGPESDGGLTVTRKTFVASGGSFVRFLDSVTNPGASALTITMDVHATVASATSTHVAVAPGPATPYAVTDGGGRPSLAHVFGGDAAPIAPSATHVVEGNSDVSYRWTVTIPAGQTISVMHFSAQRDAADRAGAIAAAQALSALTAPDALAGLTAEERARIINFRVP